MENFKKKIESWYNPISKVAKYLLFILFTIGLVIKFIPLAIRGAEFGGMITELIKFFLIIGIWLALIINAPEWSKAIINSFMQLTSNANNINYISPSRVLYNGFICIGKILSSTWNPIKLLMYVILCTVIIIIYAYIAIYILCVRIESFLISFAGLIFVSFAGDDFVSDYAKKYITYCIIAGAKLYVALLVAGFGISFIHDLMDDSFDNEPSIVLSMICIVFMFAYLVQKTYDYIQSMTSGASIGVGMNVGNA